MTDMKKSRFTEEQIIGFIKQAAAGMPIKELCRKGGFSDATFYKWRVKYGGTRLPMRGDASAIGASTTCCALSSPA
jgi:transposase-like protein